MGRPITAECGSESAYRRHLRKGEPVDEACRLAHTKAKREERADIARPESPVAEVSMPETLDRQRDLEEQRVVLWQTIKWATENDPARVAAASKELREVWRELDELRDGEQVSGDPFAEFLNAPISIAERRASS